MLNFRADFQLARQWLAYASVNNVFDTSYVTTGALARNALDASMRVQSDSSRWTSDTFYSPGAPRGIWVGLRYELGRDP